jgi:superoxide dismutase, Cu-Zn family
MSSRSLKCVVANAAAAAALFGCGGSESEPVEAPAASEGSELPHETAAEQPAPEAPAAREATAELETAPGVEMTGKAHFTSEAGGVRARVEIEKATPGKHGIHVHEKGDCSDIRGKSMGSHFTPESHPHGLPGAQARHLGDLGNIEVAPDGKGQIDITIPNATLDDGTHSFVGKALVIHEKEDVGTQPSGDSGDPIACAVIEAE